MGDITGSCSNMDVLIGMENSLKLRISLVDIKFMKGVICSRLVESDGCMDSSFTFLVNPTALLSSSTK
jgi:hypothetical protein